MGIRISAQLLLFVQSVLLGLGAGAVYGALRPLRRLRPKLAPGLDLLYALSAAAAGFAFLLRPADGVLRGYAVLGAVGGAVLWLCGFDDAVRPLWTFWTETAAWLVFLAMLPVKLTVRFLRFLLKSGESLFYFTEKCCKIQFGFRRPRGNRTAAGRKRTGRRDGMDRSGRVSAAGLSARRHGGTDRTARRDGHGADRKRNGADRKRPIQRTGRRRRTRRRSA